MSTTLPRGRWALTHGVIAVAGTLLVVALGGLGVGVASALATDDGSQVATMTGASLTYVPAVLTLAALAWLDGATAAAGDEPVRGSITLMPGSALEYVPQATGFSMSVGLGWSALVVGAVVLVVVARPWRALGSSSRRSSAQLTAGA